MGLELVGRDDELRRVRSTLQRAGVAVLVGPSGVGKTALCDAINTEWMASGASVREVRGSQGLRHVPFGALTLSLRIPPHLPESEVLERALSIFDGDGGRCLVVADDAHLLDDASAAVVCGIAQSSDIDVCLAVTSGEKVAQDLTSLWVRWPEARVDIHPLAPFESGALLQALLQRPVTTREVDQVAAVSLGFPLYITAIANELADAPSVDVDRVLATAGQSDRLVSLLERRLARLSSEERDVFDVVAFAESTELAILLACCDRDSVEGLIEAGVVRTPGERVEVSHPLLGSVARNAMTPARQREVATDLLTAIGPDALPGDVAALTHKALGAGVVPPTTHLRIAAEAALGWGDYEGVTYLAAFAAGDPELAVLGARAGRFLGEVPPTEVPLGLDQEALTEYLSATSQAMAYGERRFSDAIEFLRTGLNGVTVASYRDRLALELMVLSGLVGDMDALLGAARSVGVTTDANTRLLALSATHLAEALTLTTAASEETYATAGLLVETGSVDPHLVEQLAMSRAAVDLAEGRLEAARLRLVDSGDRALQGSWLTIEAVLADAWLPLDLAFDLATSAVEALETFDPLANLAQARLVADLRRAQLGLPVSQHGGGHHEPGVVEVDRLMHRRVEAWLARTDGDDLAGKLLAEVGRDAVASGHRFWGLSAMIDAIRLGRGPDVASDIEQLVMTRGAGLARIAAGHARADSPGRLWEASRSWWTAGAPVYAVEAAQASAAQGHEIAGLGSLLMAQRGVSPVVVPTDLGSSASQRQVDIVILVLRGATNEEIADELYLARRTIENHLHRLYKSLSLTGGREELVAELRWLSD
jgi:DNA-binding CsgD family transcriptional regulator